MKPYLILLIILSSILLITPILWLKVGPEAHINYGRHVDDVYILGAIISGKDKSWWAINFAYKFQLFFIVLYALLSLGMYFRALKNKSSFALAIINLALLVLFPFWLAIYAGHVINNSDGAGLTTHLDFGVGIYFILLVLNSIVVGKFFVGKV